MSAGEDTGSELELKLLEQRADADAQRGEIAAGLSRAGQKTLPCKWFYDERGSRLFDRICELEAYYPTRTELAILEASAGEIARLCGPGVAIVEYGAGSVQKVRILLDALEDPVAVVPIDISGEHLAAASTELARDYPTVEVKPVRADYTQPFPLPELARRPRRLVGFFPGSTIGNFHPPDAERFLARIARTVGAGGALVLGVDRKKDAAVLERAYDDPEGVTAEFNLNLLRHLNHALGTDFRIDRFRHRAVYDERAGRIEMHLESLEEQSVRVGDDVFALARGETIRTECSYKYAPEEFLALADRAGFRGVADWTDPKGWFGVHLLEAVGEA